MFAADMRAVVMMKVAAIRLVVAGTVFAAMASAYAQEPPQRIEAPGSITVERGPCMGACPVYRFRVTADGTGLFEGQRFTAVQGEHPFSITPDAWAAFQAALAPYRPQGIREVARGHPQCRHMATDHPSVSVTWEDEDGTDRLSFNFGCRDPENEAMARALADAPDLLPVADMIERLPLRDGEFHGRN